MPARPSPGNVLQVAFNTGDNATIEAGSRFFLSYSGTAPSAGNLNTLSTAVSTEWGSNLAGNVSTGESLHGVIITDLSSDTGSVGTWEGTVDGTNSGAALIASGCTVVNHEIDRRYRGGRPRTYVRMGVQTDIESGHSNIWADSYLTSALTNWEAFIAGILATTGIGISLENIVNVSWYHGNTVFTGPTGRARNIPQLRTTPIVDVIVSSTIAQKIGSQRRRLDI